LKRIFNFEFLNTKTKTHPEKRKFDLIRRFEKQDITKALQITSFNNAFSKTVEKGRISYRLFLFEEPELLDF
jgi:hypothetical protein